MTLIVKKNFAFLAPYPKTRLYSKDIHFLLPSVSFDFYCRSSLVCNFQIVEMWFWTDVLIFGAGLPPFSGKDYFPGPQYTSFYEKIESFLAFSRFQYQIFLKTFLVKIFEFWCFVHVKGQFKKLYHINDNSSQTHEMNCWIKHIRLKSKRWWTCMKFEFLMYMNLSTFLGLKNPILNFLNFLGSRALLSYKPLSYKTTCISSRARAVCSSRRLSSFSSLS